MDKLIKKYKETSSNWVKFLILIPITLLAMFYGLPHLINNEDKKRKKVNTKNKELDKKLDDSENKASKHEGRVSALEDEMKEKLDDLKNEDPASFHNRRTDK